MNGFELESLLEKVVAAVTGESVSVAILGSEISINVEGRRFKVVTGKVLYDDERKEEKA